jgi:hypothetical protein
MSSARCAQWLIYIDIHIHIRVNCLNPSHSLPVPVYGYGYVMCLVCMCLYISMYVSSKPALSGKSHCLDHHKEQSNYTYGQILLTKQRDRQRSRFDDSNTYHHDNHQAHVCKHLTTKLSLSYVGVYVLLQVWIMIFRSDTIRFLSPL